MGEAIIARRGGGGLSRYKVDDIIIGGAFEGTFVGIDNDFLYYTRPDNASGDPNMLKYNHAGTLVFSMLLTFYNYNYMNGTYNSDGCIFSNETASSVRIYDVSGTLLKDISLGGDGSITSSSGKIGYANGKIIYQAKDTSIKLKTDTGTLLDTLEDTRVDRFLSNFKKTLIGIRSTTGSEVIDLSVSIDSNTIVDLGYGTNRRPTQLAMFFL